jgi:hypothetical protein
MRRRLGEGEQHLCAQIVLAGRPRPRILQAGGVLHPGGDARDLRFGGDHGDELDEQGGPRPGEVERFRGPRGEQPLREVRGRPPARKGSGEASAGIGPDASET